MNQGTQYNSPETAAHGAIIGQIASQNDKGGVGAAILDSVKNSPGVGLPTSLASLIDEVGDKNATRILDAVGSGVSIFQSEHGFLPTGDVLQAATQQAMAAFKLIGPSGTPMLDGISNSASSAHSDPASLQPNRAVVAILSALAEAIPFASYLPVDIGSNQAKLAILSHRAGSTYGDYASGGIMDGISGGKVYASSSRFARINFAGSAPYNTKITSTNLPNDQGMCDPAGAGIPVLRGRTVVFVNGKPAARDTSQGNGPTSAIAGSVEVAGKSYSIAGTVTLGSGAVSLTSVTPAFDSSVVDVVVQSIVDYETSPALIPDVSVVADVYDLYANPWRVKTSATIDTIGQMRNELSLDASSEAIMAMRSQMAMERHYIALGMASRLAKNHIVPHNFEWAARSSQMVRAQIWQDFMAVLANADQKMAENTMDHGITHLYVPAFIAGILNSLPGDMFRSSGIAARPSIYRVGRLFDKYEVYYSPFVAWQSADLKSAKIIGIGRSSNVAQCPIVLGDAVSPTFLDLNMQSDLKKSAAIYARDFTEVNPHEPSSLGACEINMTNLA